MLALGRAHNRSVLLRSVLGLFVPPFLGLRPANAMWRKLLYSRRVMAPAPKVLGRKHISTPDFACMPFYKKKGERF